RITCLAHNAAPCRYYRPRHTTKPNACDSRACSRKASAAHERHQTVKEHTLSLCGVDLIGYLCRGPRRVVALLCQHGDKNALRRLGVCYNVLTERRLELCDHLVSGLGCIWNDNAALMDVRQFSHWSSSYLRIVFQ